eukprot:UN04542
MSEQAPAANQLNIKVRSQQGEEVYFKIKPHTTMQKIINAFADRIGVDPGSLRLTFDGSRVKPEDTAESLDLQDNDVIDVMEFQVGGGL